MSMWCWYFRRIQQAQSTCNASLNELFTTLFQ